MKLSLYNNLISFLNGGWANGNFKSDQNVSRDWMATKNYIAINPSKLYILICKTTSIPVNKKINKTSVGKREWL